MPIHIIMPALESLPNEHGRKVGENECLDKGYQYFYQVNEYGKYDGNRRKAPAYSFIHGPENEDQGNEAQDNDVARHHVGKKTDDQCEWLGEHTQDLHGYQDWLDAHGHRRVNNVAPVMLVGAEHDNYKRNNAQYRRKGHVAGYVGGAWQQAEYVIDKNEEENRKQVRQVFIGLLSQIGPCHVIANKGDNRLNGILQAGRRGAGAVALLVPFCQAGHDPY